MSRNGAARSWPCFRMRIRPACSTMKSRPEESGAYVAYTGLWRPAATLVNLKELRGGVVVVGVTGEGVGMGDVEGDGVGAGVAEGDGVARAAVFWPEQPANNSIPATIKAQSRTRKG